MVSPARAFSTAAAMRSEEHTSELQSHLNLVCRLLLEKKKKKNTHAGKIFTKPKTGTRLQPATLLSRTASSPGASMSPSRARATPHFFPTTDTPPHTYS